MRTYDSSTSRRGLSRREILRRGAVGAAGLLLAACGQQPSPSAAPAATSAPAAQATAPAAAPASGAPPSSTSAAAAPKPASGGAAAKLVFWRHQYDPTDKAYKEVIFPDAQAKLGTEVDYQIQRDDDYKTKMLPQLASGVGPDIFEATEAFRLKFAKAGVYAPVDYGPWGGKEKWDAFWEK